MMKKLKYVIKTASKRIDEMKDDMIDDDMGDKVQGPSRRRYFQDILPQSRIMQNTVPDFRNLSSHPPRTKAPVVQPMAKGAKNTSQKRNAAENDYSFLFVDVRLGGAGGTYYGNNNKQRKDSNKMPRREDQDGNPPNDQDPDDDDDDKHGDDDDTPNVDGHRLLGSSARQQPNTEVASCKP